MTEPTRHRLHDGLKEAIGDENAGTLMQMLPPYSWDEIAKRSDVEDLRVSLEGKIEALDTKFEGKLDAMGTRIEGVEAKIDSLKAMIEAIGVGINGRVDRLFGKLLLANLGVTISICGLLLAAIKLGV